MKKSNKKPTAPEIYSGVENTRKPIVPAMADGLNVYDAVYKPT